MTKPATADRNLLFGILAVQMDFVSQAKLIQAMNAWVLNKSRSLGELLVEQQSLSPERRALLAQVQPRRELGGAEGSAERILAVRERFQAERERVELARAEPEPRR